MRRHRCHIPSPSHGGIRGRHQQASIITTIQPMHHRSEQAARRPVWVAGCQQATPCCMVGVPITRAFPRALMDRLPRLPSEYGCVKPHKAHTHGTAGPWKQRDGRIGRAAQPWLREGQTCSPHLQNRLAEGEVSYIPLIISQPDELIARRETFCSEGRESAPEPLRWPCYLAHVDTLARRPSQDRQFFR